MRSQFYGHYLSISNVCSNIYVSILYKEKKYDVYARNVNRTIKDFIQATNL